MIKTIVKIEGMMCGMCEAHINDAIRNSFDIKKVKSSHRKGQTIITSSESIDKDKLKEVIDKTGYHFISAEEK